MKKLLTVILITLSTASFSSADNCWYEQNCWYDANDVKQCAYEWTCDRPAENTCSYQNICRTTHSGERVCEAEWICN